MSQKGIGQGDTVQDEEGSPIPDVGLPQDLQHSNDG